MRAALTAIAVVLVLGALAEAQMMGDSPTGPTAGSEDVCTGCSAAYEPVCATGVTTGVEKTTHANQCYAQCSCDLYGLSPCVLNQGECTGTPTPSDSGCPNLPQDLAASQAYREWSKSEKVFDIVIDVRTKTEFEGLGTGDFALGRIPGSILAESIASQPVPEDIDVCKDARVLLVCRSGSRSLAALQKLKARGFKCVYHIDGGTKAWVNLGYTTEKGTGPVVGGTGAEAPPSPLCDAPASTSAAVRGTPLGALVFAVASVFAAVFAL
mmetsp:Transcript_7600/g.19004  ORF Transcript_7600/g.19004 Transcript_7600/m.19004 type:complete len:268 (+) Transcript_7600:116-919(+)